MKYLYALPLMFLLLTSCKKEETTADGEVIDRVKTDWYFYKLNGNVKSLSEKSFILDNGIKGAPGWENSSLRDTDFQFNEKGKLINQKQFVRGNVTAEETTFNGKDSILIKTQYINGAAGIITQYSWDKKTKNNTAITRRNASNQPMDRIEMKYKGKNLTEKTTYNNQNNPIDIITYDYDDKGNLKGENLFLGIQTVQIRNRFEYDSKNRKTGEIRYSKDKLISKSIYEYNNDDKLISSEISDGNGQLEYSEKSGFDDKGNMRSHITYKTIDNSQEEELYTYDLNNNMTSWTLNNRNVPVMKVVYAYDKNNNLISTKTTDAKGKPVENRIYKYNYDSNNNWTKKTISINGQQKFVVERTLFYY